MKSSKWIISTLIFGLGLFLTLSGYAQTPPGIAEINQGKAHMAQNFQALSALVLVVGAVFGLIGGLRVYNNWQMGKERIDIEVTGWLASCIFLSIIGLFLSGLFNVPLI